ncbi:MAG: energy transducer TonB [Acidobacteriota bacterium]|nr:energy transducer TonB [Acidobacteriota bacterium]
MLEQHRAVLGLLFLVTFADASSASTQLGADSGAQPLRAGINGTSSPQCAYCPQPAYSDEARAANYSGTVILDVTVTASGKVVDPVVLRNPGLGLDKKALSQVGKWEMKPALGPNGKPVDCRVQVEVTFHLYPNASSLNDSKAVAGIAITMAVAAEMKLGYRGVLLGHEVYEQGTKTPSTVLSPSGCTIEDRGVSPPLNEEFFSVSGSTACVVNAGEDGRVNRILVDSRSSVPNVIETFTKKYGAPRPGLYRVSDNGPVDATFWAWEVYDENGIRVNNPSISIEPKIRASQRKDEYSAYVEIVFQQ